MSPRFTSLLISVFASSALLLTSTAGAAPKKAKADTAKEKAAKEEAAKEEAAKEEAAKEEAAKEEAAKEEAAKEEAAKEEAAKEEAAKEQAAKDDAAKEQAAKDAAATDAEASGSPIELPGKTYYGVGLRYRAIIVPTFMMNLFGSGGATVLANGIGPEFTIRKNSFEYEFSAMYTSYAMDATAFKAKSDPPEAWEIVESHIKVMYLMADFNWSHDFVPQFSWNYGFGAGAGIVWGPLYRTQAYPGPGGNPSTGEGFLPCAGPGNPNAQYCGSDNNHYNGYSEPSWSNGGSKPVIFPWLALQTGLRYKPHRNFIARLDAGFSTSGFFFGLGADYGL